MGYLWWVLGWYGVMSLVSCCAYGVDKLKARKGLWRVQERTLHTLDGLGGWPGGLLAQRVFRHKTRDGKFRVIFWITVAAHVLAWGGVAWILLRRS